MNWVIRKKRLKITDLAAWTKNKM